MGRAGAEVAAVRELATFGQAQRGPGAPGTSASAGPLLAPGAQTPWGAHAAGVSGGDLQAPWGRAGGGHPAHRGPQTLAEPLGRASPRPAPRPRPSSRRKTRAAPSWPSAWSSPEAEAATRGPGGGLGAGAPLTEARGEPLRLRSDRSISFTLLEPPATREARL